MHQRYIPQRYPVVRIYGYASWVLTHHFVVVVNCVRRRIAIPCYEYHSLVPILEWVPMGEGSVTVPVADNGATEVTAPFGFRFGDSIHHYIYVSRIYTLCGLINDVVCVE